MSVTPTYRPTFFKRLWKNKAAIFGLCIIVIAIIMAVFAYFIAPDHSPNANRIIPEIANKNPGFSIKLLRLKKTGEPLPATSTFNWLLNGREDAYTFIPINSYVLVDDSIFAQKFVDDGINEPLSIGLISAADKPVVQKTFYLGTDKFGRDMASRLIIGTRVSLSVGCIALIISLAIGIVLGALAGYFGGWVNNIIMWLINTIWSIPSLLLVFAITLLLGKGFWQVFVAVGLTMWVNVARLVRGQILAIREMEYIEAAKVLGYSNTRTIVHHILPNIMGPVIVIAAGNFASAIVIEAGLSFLGLGVQTPQPSWGLMIKENYNFIITNHPMLAVEPGLAIMLLVLAFNLLGNGLRDALQVKNNI